MINNVLTTNETTMTEKLASLEAKIYDLEATITRMGAEWVTTTTATQAQTPEPQQPKREWYTPRQFAELVGYSTPYVYNLIYRGALEVTHVAGGRKVLISREAVERYIGTGQGGALSDKERAAVEAYNNLTKGKK